MKCFYKNLWILLSFICIAYAWDETRNLKTLGEKEFLRLKSKLLSLLCYRISVYYLLSF